MRNGSTGKDVESSQENVQGNYFFLEEERSALFTVKQGVTQGHVYSLSPILFSAFLNDLLKT